MKIISSFWMLVCSKHLLAFLFLFLDIIICFYRLYAVEQWEKVLHCHINIINIESKVGLYHQFVAQYYRLDKSICRAINNNVLHRLHCTCTLELKWCSRNLHVKSFLESLDLFELYRPSYSICVYEMLLDIGGDCSYFEVKLYKQNWHFSTSEKHREQM